MENKHQVHNLIILDESGSMEGIKHTIIQGFNELVQTIKGIQTQFPEQEHFISFISFNGLRQKILHFTDPVTAIQQINADSYQPDASTPLFDAMGFSINKLKHTLQGKSDYNVLVTVLTDGEENASKEFSGADIKKMVDELKEQSWTFTYIGTDHDVEKIASALSITNTMVFSKNDADIKNMFMREKSARVAYSRRVHMKDDHNGNYFEESDDNKVENKIPPTERSQTIIEKLKSKIKTSLFNNK